MKQSQKESLKRLVKTFPYWLPMIVVDFILFLFVLLGMAADKGRLYVHMGYSKLAYKKEASHD